MFRQIIKRRFLGKTVKTGEREERKEGGEGNAPHSEWAPSAILQSLLHSLWHPAEISGMEATHGNAARGPGMKVAAERQTPTSYDSKRSLSYLMGKC